MLPQDSGSEIRISTRRLSRFESELSLARSGFQGPNPITTTSAALTPGVATLEIMRGAGGHMPHEADVETFCALLQKHGVVGTETARC